jgi:hypothetical protein
MLSDKGNDCIALEAQLILVKRYIGGCLCADLALYAETSSNLIEVVELLQCCEVSYMYDDMAQRGKKCCSAG